MFRALQSKSRVECGYASIGDVRSGALDDRMDSYFLSETLKYLFLLFDRLVRGKIGSGRVVSRLGFRWSGISGST